MDDDLWLTGRSKNIFSKGKWEAEDMLVDHESGTDNMVDKVKDRWWEQNKYDSSQSMWGWAKLQTEEIYSCQWHEAVM